MANWFVRHKDHDWNTTVTLRPENLSFQKNHRQISNINYEVSLSTVTAGNHKVVTHDFAGPKRTNYELVRDDVVIMSGPHTMVKGAAGDEYVQIAGADWLQRLDWRFFPFNPDSPNDFLIQFNGQDPPQGLAFQAGGIDPSDILTKIFDVVFSMPYSYPKDFSYSLSPVGYTTDYRLDLGDTTSILSIVENLASEEPGFDYDITPGRRFRTFSPYKYGAPDDYDPVWIFYAGLDKDRPEGLEFTNTGPTGTHVLGLGAGLAQRKGISLGYELGQQIFGRIDEAVDFGNESRPVNLFKRTQAHLSLGLNPVHEIPIKVNPNNIPYFWTTFDAGLAINIIYDLGFHMINSGHQIITMDCRVSNEGEEEVDLLLNQIYVVDNEPGVIEG